MTLERSCANSVIANYRALASRERRVALALTDDEIFPIIRDQPVMSTPDEDEQSILDNLVCAHEDKLRHMQRERTPHVGHDEMHRLLQVMLRGWQLHADSFRLGEPGRYERDPIDCMVEAAGGDAVIGRLLYLFGEHWSNDIRDEARAAYDLDTTKEAR